MNMSKVTKYVFSFKINESISVLNLDGRGGEGEGCRPGL